MRLRLRILWLFLSSLWRPPLKLLDESLITLMVLPNDIDIQKISNDRYIALMDLGRMDIAFRSGLIYTMFRQGWAPLAAFNTIRFRHPLKIFQRCQLRTRVIYWDEYGFYFQQHFVIKGRIAATGYVYGGMLGKNGHISPEEVFAAYGEKVTKPEKPEMVTKLQELNAMIHEQQKDA